MERLVFALALAAPFSALGCGDEGVPAPPPCTHDIVRPSVGCEADAPPTRTISCIESFVPGANAGYGQDRFPDVVYGEPHGGGVRQGSLDVVSLGAAGEIVVGFGGNTIVDGPGVDFIVFENAFYIGGHEDKPFKELGEVAVSADGKSWTVFPCQSGAYPYEGCAGWKADFANPDVGICALDADVAGGDQFDLATIDVREARFVRIRDLSKKPTATAAATNAGFDLDAIAIVNAKTP